MPFIYVRHRPPLSTEASSPVTVLALSDEGLPALDQFVREDLESGALKWTGSLSSVETCALLNAFDAQDWSIVESDALVDGEKVTTFARDRSDGSGGMGDLLKMFGMPAQDDTSSDSGSDVEEHARKPDQ